MGAKTPMAMKLSTLIAWALVLLSYGAGNIDGATLDGDETDLRSLLDFKQAITNYPREALSSWNTSLHFCRWEGVTCSAKRPPRVEQLHLVGHSLEGQISPSLGNLTFLRILNLSTNGFSGIIPDTLTNCSKLCILDLSRNFLEGEIPSKIDRLSNLLCLELAVNKLSGIIPPALGNITSLIAFEITYNQIEGSIPVELGKLLKLKQLSIGENRLSGRVPRGIFNLSLLQVLAIPLNRLGYALPSDIGDTLPNLRSLALAGNLFEGHLPASLGNASNLEMIDLSQNKFTGQVPSSFGKLLKLYVLDLSVNQLEAKDTQSWQFLYALSNCRKLQKLSLGRNQLQGILPNSIGNLPPNLQYLQLGENNISGLIPSTIGNLQGLTKLELEYNNFIGTIEEWIGKLIKLVVLRIQRNKFIGTIPSSISNLTLLSELVLANNGLEGLIPSSLGSLQHLSTLDLSHNYLHGNIPKEIFGVTTMTKCILSYNNLEGLIVSEVGNLQQLTELDLSSNKLNGEIPDTLGKCLELDTIQMGQNLLSGSIPASLGNLSILKMLNLSHNNLCGAIPTSLSNLQPGVQLDLSYNQLQGEIPRNGIFKNSTAVSLDGNWRLCGGVMDLHMTPCPAISRRRGTQYYLTISLIPIFGFLTLISLIYIALLKKKDPRMYFSLHSFGSQFCKIYYSHRKVSNVSYKDLAQATDNFSDSNLIGRGSYSSVFKGRLAPEKMDVAVKVFDLELHGADGSFMAECEALRSVRHRNLLPIQTTCSAIDTRGNTFKAIVFEFMPNGNLETWLHPKGGRKDRYPLDLAPRLNIAVNIADALDYLHHDCLTSIVHCDLKPSNILLDDAMIAHLGDFGIARFYHPSSASSIGLKGTIGYIAPEYAGGLSASTSGDVYSFGVVLLEMLTCRRPTDPMFCNGLDIVNFVEKNFPNHIFHAIDAHLREECQNFAGGKMEVTENANYKCLLALLKLALLCARQCPSERMNMRETATELHAIKTSYIGGRAKHSALV